MADSFQSVACAQQLKALSEPIRLRIIDILRQRSLSVGEVAEALQVELVTASHHLGILKQAHLVEAVRDGRFMVYHLREDLLEKPTESGPEFLNLGCCRLEIPACPETIVLEAKTPSGAAKG